MIRIMLRQLAAGLSGITHCWMRGFLFHDEHHAKRHAPADHGLDRAFQPQHAPCKCLRNEAPWSEAARQRIDNK